MTSYSALSTAGECKRKFAYRYAHRLKPIDREKPKMLLGSWWHAVRAADAIERGSRKGSLLAAPDYLTTGDDGPRLIVPLDAPGSPLRTHGISDGGDRALSSGPYEEQVVEASALWWERLSVDRSEAFVEEIGATLPGLLTGLVERYRERWADELATEEPLLVEAEWTRVLPTSDVEVRGRIDEVYRDGRRGLVVVRDVKSHTSWPSEPDAVLDLMDSQLHLYAWGASGLLADTPYSVQAIEYDRARVKPPATPSLTKSGNLSKSTTDFDLWTYLRWIESGDATYERYKKHIPSDELAAAQEAHEEAQGSLPEDERSPFDWKTIAEASVTEPDPDVIEDLSTEEARQAFFRRSTRPISIDVVRSHLRAALDGAKTGDEIRAAVKEGADIPRTPAKSCAWCDYLSLCRAEMYGPVDPETDPATFGLKNLPAGTE